MIRSFTIIDYPREGDTYGNYNAKTPLRAANKAFSRLSRMIDLKNSNHKNLLVFSIKDVTSDRKYKYVGTRVELNQPIVVDYYDKFGKSKKIKYRYKNMITPYNKFFV